MDCLNCCRICLSSSSNLIGIFDFNTGMTLSEQIMYCASVEINSLDRLPKYICSLCKSNLDIAFRFKTDCENNNKKLHSIIGVDAENISILRNSFKSNEETINSEIVFFDDSSLLHEETVSSNNVVEIDMINKNNADISQSPINEPLDTLSVTENRELRENTDVSKNYVDEKVVVIQMNANIVADISKSVTEKLSKSPVGRHIAKKKSSQIPRKINRCPEPFSNNLNSEIKSMRPSANKAAIAPIAHQIDSSSMSEESFDSDHQFTCTICNKYYETYKQLTRHIKTHSKMKLYICKVCNKGFKNSYNLSVHNLKHSGKFPLKCKICKKGFANTSVLKRHSISHNGETPFHCKHCKKEFSYEYSLRIHEAIHVDRPKYTCDICFKIFSYTNSLSAHLKTHNGDRPHACKICPSLFTRNTSLRRHMVQNHGENQLFSCKICEEQFKTKEECRNHENTRHLKVKCDFCSRRFSNNSLLFKHLKIHKSFPCKLCDKKYKSNNALVLHCKRMH